MLICSINYKQGAVCSVTVSGKIDPLHWFLSPHYKESYERCIIYVVFLSFLYDFVFEHSKVRC